MKKILWLIQSNQITPTIHDFLKLLQTRMERQLDLSFIVPETSPEILDRTKALKPSCVKLATRSATTSYNG